METQAHVPGEVKTLPAEHKGTVAGAKPHLSFWQIWNMCFGFLGLQFGFALQNANVSRIFQTLAATHSNGICSRLAPRVWKMRLTLAFCRAKPNCRTPTSAASSRPWVRAW